MVKEKDCHNCKHMGKPFLYEDDFCYSCVMNSDVEPPLHWEPQDITREATVRDFQKAMGATYGLSLQDEDQAHVKRVLSLNWSLISEEWAEVQDELWTIHSELVCGNTPQSGDIEKLLKELADLQYVISHFASAFGLPLDEAFKRVHESNMSKLDDNGNPVRREDGKIMKGPNYKAPNLEDLV